MESSATPPIVVATDDADAGERAAILAELDGVAEVRFLHDAAGDARAEHSPVPRSCSAGT